jgi:hypothetical protein
VAVNFSALEIHISAFIWCLILDDQKVGQMITAGMSFPRMIDLLAALVRYKTSDADVLHDLDIFVRQVSSAEQERNAIMHSAWATTPRGDVSRLKIIAARKGLKHHFEARSALELRQVAYRIGEAARRTLLLLGFLEHKGIVKPPRP